MPGSGASFQPCAWGSSRNEDLFWALRGGGGNFGIVTSFEFRLHPLKSFAGGPIFYELDAAPDVMRAFRDYTADRPTRLPVGAPDW